MNLVDAIMILNRAKLTDEEKEAWKTIRKLAFAEYTKTRKTGSCARKLKKCSSIPSAYNIESKLHSHNTTNSAIATFEAGYKSCERGENLQSALAHLNKMLQQH